MKADKLLKNITDRKERTDPFIPSNLSTISSSTKLKPNGTSTNGHIHGSVSIISKQSSSAKPSHRRRLFRLDTPFAETPAITRSGDGMSRFAALDKGLDRQTGVDTTKYGFSSLDERLREYIVTEDFESESESSTEPGSPMSIDGSVIGEKRKLYVHLSSLRFHIHILFRNGVDGHRPRKRPRHTHIVEDKDTVELWWDAVRSDNLLANGLPSIPCASSQDHPPHRLPPKKSKPKPKPSKRRKKPGPAPKSLLTLMNNNISTIKRVRHTHAKFADLNRSNNSNNEDRGDTPVSIELSGEPDGAGADVDVDIDERPWKPQGSGIEIGDANGDACLSWMTGKVLEHVGFQGPLSLWWYH